MRRNPAMDIIRCFALFTVLWVHFFSKSHYYANPVAGEKMYIATLIRTMCMICVPLFIVLSGYLMKNKQLNAQYFSKIGYTLSIYVLASLACVAYNHWFLEQKASLKTVILGILDFTAAPYAWYIEMYIGLFLLIPFLNILYNNIPTRKWKLILIFFLCFMTMLGGVVNVYNFEIAEWWSNPRLSGEYQKLMPFWWSGCYPITYYFIGCYLNEYGFSMKKRWNVLLIIVAILLFGTYNYWRSYDGNFLWGAWQSYNSFFVLILTLLIFGLLMNVNYSWMPNWMRRFFQWVSGLCLGGYLVSWIFDSVFYPEFNAHFPKITDRFIHCIWMVPLIYTCSILLSWILNLIYKMFIFTGGWIAVRLKK